MKRDDPTATYRGYRRQALYCLFRLFDDALDQDFAIQPEGVEDLAITEKDGRLIEIVQVKDLTSSLVASSFQPFFYERVAPYCAAGSHVKVRIATFGPIGPDLLAASANDGPERARVVETISKDREVIRKNVDGTIDTITKRGLPSNVATEIVGHVTFEPVSEVILSEKIKQSLRQTVVGVNPSDAFEFLMWWMLTSSESKRVIRRRDAIEKLTTIGKFLTERQAFHTEWYNSIIPLDALEFEATAEQASKLRDEFFCGGRVRFDHILADIDVPRTEPMSKIHSGFSTSSVVVVHSASGQGKTTLAFRYLKELAPATYRFQLHSTESAEHARRMALAIRGHSAAIAVPTIVFIDVRPGDINWVDLVRELASEELIRVLITIREEDWHRTNISAADFHFQDVSLDFDSTEARLIFESLEGQRATDFIDFDEAWIRFGVRKTLLEFVYFVTQAETLTQRLRAQVRYFQNEVRTGRADPSEEMLLRLVAVASSYEARIDLARTMSYCRISSPIATLRRFEEEYFIRESANGKLLDGYHAIRSTVLSECLTDAALYSWEAVAASALPLMEERDVEAFLMCAFSRRPETTAALVDALVGFAPTTWAGVIGVMRSLLWLGLREYWASNREAVDEAARENPSGWWLLIEWDLAGVLGKDSASSFDNLGDQGALAATQARQLRSKLVATSTVFEPIRRWLVSRKSPIPNPNATSDWSSFAEAMYWCGHLRVPATILATLDLDAISYATSTLPLYLIGDFIRGLREAQPELVAEWLSINGATFFEQVRKAAAIVKLDKTEDSVVAHYLIDLESETSRLRPDDQSSEISKASFHDLTMERVDLLSQLISGQSRYGAIGYGHRQFLFSSMFDEADKSGVLAENLHPQWAVRFNALSRGIALYRFRPEDWQEFFSRLDSLRSQALACLHALRLTIADLRHDPTAPPILRDAIQWDDCRKSFSSSVEFPKCAVDEWGYFTESAMPSQGTALRLQSSAGRFISLRKAITEYVRTVSNFLDQVIHGVVLAPALQNAKSEGERQRILNVGAKHGISSEMMRLSVINGCDAWTAIRDLHTAFDQFEVLRDRRNRDLERREQREFPEAMDDWAQFVFPSKRTELKDRDNLFGWVLTPIRNRLKNNLQALRRHRIIAKVLPASIAWEGRPGLWIQADVIHPIATAAALVRIWEAIWKSFGTHSTNPLPYSASNVMWKNIVVVPTINGRSIDQTAYRHFKHAAFREGSSLDDMLWVLLPDRVPDATWEQVELESWPPMPETHRMDVFRAMYSILFHHVHHLADFNRLPEADSVGVSILEEYFRREERRLEPMLQAAYDAYTDLIQYASSVDCDECPDLLEALHAIREIETSIKPSSDGFDESEGRSSSELNLAAIVEWRDRLSSGLEIVGRASCYWAAHLLNCPNR